MKQNYKILVWQRLLALALFAVMPLSHARYLDELTAQSCAQKNEDLNVVITMDKICGFNPSGDPSPAEKTAVQGGCETFNDGRNYNGKMDEFLAQVAKNKDHACEMGKKQYDAIQNYYILGWGWFDSRTKKN